MKTKEKKPALNGAIIEKKLTPKQRELFELAEKASKLGGKLFREGKLKPL